MATDDGSVTISAAIRLHPLRKVDSGAGFDGDLQQYAESFCQWMTAPLSEFADRRGGDCFVAVVIQRGDETAGMEYRDGAFVKPEAPVPVPEPSPAAQPGRAGCTARE